MKHRTQQPVKVVPFDFCAPGAYQAVIAASEAAYRRDERHEPQDWAGALAGARKAEIDEAERKRLEEIEAAKTPEQRGMLF